MSDPPNAALQSPSLAQIPVTPSSSLWDRITTWASEHKAAVYTIAGVTLVVTGAGVIYYSSSSPRVSEQAAAEREERRKARKDKKKGKKDASPRDSTISSGGKSI